MMVADRGAEDRNLNLTQMSDKLLRSDFEAAIHLKLWDDLEKIIDASEAMGGGVALTDCARSAPSGRQMRMHLKHWRICF